MPREPIEDCDVDDDDGDTPALPGAKTHELEPQDPEGGASLAALASVHGFVRPTS